MSAISEISADTLRYPAELLDFYNQYAEALDDLRLSEWAEMFAENCSYQIISRENYAAGHQLCVMYADSKGMIEDRVRGIERTQIFAPRHCRRFFSGTRMTGSTNDEIQVRQNVLVVQSLLDQMPTILLSGVAHDCLVRHEGKLQIKTRTVVTDSELIESSLIYPA